MKKKIARVRLIFVFLLCLTMIPVSAKEKTGYLPFGHESITLLLQKVIENRMIPYSFPKNHGISLKITDLKKFEIDWEAGKISTGFSFSVKYDEGFLEFKRTGTVGLVGVGLFSAEEEKLGLKLDDISEFKLDKTNFLINQVAHEILKSQLCGKEFWSGPSPKVSKEMNGKNFTELLEVVIRRNLPITGKNNAVTVNLTDLTELTMLPEIGQLKMKCSIDGKYKMLFDFPFKGDMGFVITAMVNPEDMDGLVKINSLTDFNLQNTFSLLDSLVKKLINSDIRGNQYFFDLKK